MAPSSISVDGTQGSFGAPDFEHSLARRQDTASNKIAAPPNTYGDWRDVNDPEAFIIEAWGEGFMLGALLIMAIITVANMRKGVLLHKLILLELLFAMSHGTFCFMAFKGYGWYLSSTAALLYCSYFTHNVVAWLKIRPFFSGPQPLFKPRTCRIVQWVYLSTLAMSAPVTVFEIFNNFRFFNNMSTLYMTVRPYEPLFRDPWWLFSCAILFEVVIGSYGLNILGLIRRSSRFAILLIAIILAVIFTCMDIAASKVEVLSVTDGINPYWKLALVFKCLTDNIMLDDFKSVLQRLGAVKLDGTPASMHRNSQSFNVVLSPNEKSPVSFLSHPFSDHEDTLVSPCSGPDRSASDPSVSSQRRLWTHSISGRALEDGEILDSRGMHGSNAGGGSGRRSAVVEAVGRLGIRIQALPRLPGSGDRASRPRPPPLPLVPPPPFCRAVSETVLQRIPENVCASGQALGRRRHGALGSVDSNVSNGPNRNRRVGSLDSDGAIDPLSSTSTRFDEQPPWDQMDFITTANSTAPCPATDPDRITELHLSPGEISPRTRR